MAAHKNECRGGARQIVKTQSKTSQYFIAIREALGSPTGAMVAAMAVILAQVVLNMPDVFGGFDLSGLVALGGVTASFGGSDNPRELRVIQALLVRPRRREDVDAIAGASNGPDLISNLRDLFPKSDDRNEYIACERIHFTDRDGRSCRPGVYSLTALGRRLIHLWLAKIAKAVSNG